MHFVIYAEWLFLIVSERGNDLEGFVEIDRPCVFHIYVVKDARIVCGRDGTSDWWIRDDWFWKLPESAVCRTCSAAIRRLANSAAA